MFRFLLRAVGFVLMATAFAAVVVDGSRSIAGGHLMTYALADTAAWFGGPRYAAVAESLARMPEPVRPLLVGVLSLPTSVVTGMVGLLFLLAGRPPARRPGFSGRGPRL